MGHVKWEPLDLRLVMGCKTASLNLQVALTGMGGVPLALAKAVALSLKGKSKTRHCDLT